MRKATTKMRALTSFFLLIVSFVVFLSGLGLYLAPSGRVARQTGWSFLGLTKWQLESWHRVWAFVMAGLLILHLILNWKLFWGEIKAFLK